MSGDNKYSCDGCKKKVNALKSTSIDSLPQCLIVDFVRYSFGRKNQEIIEYPKSIDLKPFTSASIDNHNLLKIKTTKSVKPSPGKAKEYPVYDLYAVIVH